MAKIIELPKLSPTMEEGTLVRWAKKVGDAVDIDDLLAEVETDKATMEFRAFDRGTVLKLLVDEGAVVLLGAPVAIFGAPGEDVSALTVAPSKAPAAEPQVDAAPAASPTPKTIPPKARAVEEPAVAAVRGERGVAGTILAPSSPRVRRLAREADIDLEEVQGSGRRGRVSEADLAATSVDLSRVVREGDTVSDASSMRRTIARRLVEAKQTVPHFYLEVDLDVDALLELRQRINSEGAPDAKVSVNDLLIRACALSLRAVPEANASWIGGKVVRYGRVDISVAVAIDDGLLTPVVRGADRLTVSAISGVVRDLATRARARKLSLEEMQGGTFSISNLGMMGIDRFAAVINPPESMILAVGAAREVPVVKGGLVVPGRRCAVTLSCDHRVVDGALGARWLQALRSYVENPMRILA